MSGLPSIDSGSSVERPSTCLREHIYGYSGSPELQSLSPASSATKLRVGNLNMSSERQKRAQAPSLTASSWSVVSDGVRATGLDPGRLDFLSRGNEPPCNFCGRGPHGCFLRSRSRWVAFT